MSTPRAVFLIALLFTALGWSILHLFDAGFQSGQLYPNYSSLRKDAAGTSILFESLSRLLPRTERNYLPLEQIDLHRSTLMLLGVNSSQLAVQNVLDYSRLGEIAKQGNRVVIALEPAMPLLASTQAVNEAAWGIRIHSAPFTRSRPAEIYFTTSPEWTVVAGKSDRVKLAERRLGAGSLVMASSGALFRNGAVAISRNTAELAIVLGPSERIVFDESHLGLAESGSIMGLITAFRLRMPLLAMLFCVSLWIWKNAVSFPPLPPGKESAPISGRTLASGLVALLERNLPPSGLAAISWQESLKGGLRPVSPERKSLVEEALRSRAPQPLETLRRIHDVLNTKGTS